MILLHANTIEQRTVNPFWIRFINQRFTDRKGNMTPRTLIHTVLLMAVMAAVGLVVMDRASAAEGLTGNEAIRTGEGYGKFRASRPSATCNPTP